MPHTKSLIEKQGELIEHLKAYYDAQRSPAVKLIHPQWENHLEKLESEISALQEQEKKELDTELENKLIDFANWYLRLIKVTTDKDERYEIENREMIWSFLRGDDYKLWWNKFGESVDQSGIRDEMIKFWQWYDKCGIVGCLNPNDLIDEYLKSNQ